MNACILGAQAATKWKDIRDAYVKARRNNMMMMLTKGGQEMKPYKYSPMLEFLLPHIQPHPGRPYVSGAMQVLRNADGGGGVKFSGGKALRRCNVQRY